MADGGSPRNSGKQDFQATIQQPWEDVAAIPIYSLQINVVGLTSSEKDKQSTRMEQKSLPSAADKRVECRKTVNIDG
jgi:hypothetical protein